MRIAVVGGGMAGPVAALLLARDRHDVTLVEAVADPRPVGAGILLQPLGQDVLSDLGLPAAACADPIIGSVRHGRAGVVPLGVRPANGAEQPRSAWRCVERVR